MTAKHQDDVDAWLDGIEVHPADAWDATHIRRIVAAAESVTEIGRASCRERV